MSSFIDLFKRCLQQELKHGIGILESGSELAITNIQDIEANSDLERIASIVDRMVL
ncbi:MAG: hypothetical protein R3A13_07210 [Bdellovibrionota bacterium]